MDANLGKIIPGSNESQPHHISNLANAKGYNRKSVGSSHRIHKDYPNMNRPIVITQGSTNDQVNKRIESNMKHTTSTPGMGESF